MLFLLCLDFVTRISMRLCAYKLVGSDDDLTSFLFSGMKIWITLTPLQKSVYSFSFWNFFIAFRFYFGLACISFLFVPLSMYVSLCVSCVQAIHCVCLTVCLTVCVMCGYLCVFLCLFHVCKCSIICVWLCLTAWMGWFWLCYCLYGLSNWFFIHALLVFQCRLPIYGDVFRDANHVGHFEQSGIQRRALVRLLSYW